MGSLRLFGVLLHPTTSPDKVENRIYVLDILDGLTGSSKETVITDVHLITQISKNRYVLLNLNKC